MIPAVELVAVAGRSIGVLRWAHSLSLLSLPRAKRMPLQLKDKSNNKVYLTLSQSAFTITGLLCVGAQWYGPCGAPPPP